MPFSVLADYTPEVFDAVAGVITVPLGHAITISGKAERNAATDAAKDQAVPRCAARALRSPAASARSKRLFAA